LGSTGYLAPAIGLSCHYCPIQRGFESVGLEEVRFMHILKSLKLAVITALSVGFLFSGSFAYANEIYSQLIGDTASGYFNHGAQNQLPWQRLGNNLDGTVNSITVKVQAQNVGAKLYVTLQANNGDSQSGGTCTALGSNNVWYSQEYTFTDTDIKTINFNSNTASTTLTANDLANTNCYWTLTYWANNTNIRVYGNATNDAYTDGVFECLNGVNCAGGTLNVNGIYDAYFSINDHFGNSEDETRIISMTPEDGETVASSSPVTLTGTAYVTEEDAGCFLGFGCTFVVFTLQDQNDALNDNTILYNEQIDTEGYFEFSTSTTLQEGNYAIQGIIYKSLFGSTGTFNTLYPKTWNEFIVGTSTFTGSLIQNSSSDITDILAGLTPTTTPIVANSCNPISGFDTIQCIAFLFIPSQRSLESIGERIHEEILLVAPWGYITRFLNIVTSDDRVALPTFTITYPSELEFMGGATLSLNPWPYLMASSSLLGTVESYGSDPKTFREITEDGWNFIILSIFAITVFFRVMNVDIAMPTGSEVSEKVSDFRRRNEGTGGLRNKKRGM